MGLGIRTFATEKARRLRRDARDAVLRRGGDVATVRADVALRYLRGDGIEIGGLNFPLVVPREARVRYVDRKDVSGLRADFPELADTWIVPVDVVDDGETLPSFADDSLDFVVANHMIEHTEDPIRTLHAHLRVLRPGGILYLAIPDRRYTFDVVRGRTPLEHHVRDHEEGPGWSRRDHYREWVRLLERFNEPDVEARAEKLEAERASIHFHVWEIEDFLALVEHCRRAFDLPARVAHVQRNGVEFLTLLRKDGAET